jgi:hypothetical protein
MSILGTRTRQASATGLPNEWLQIAPRAAFPRTTPRMRLGLQIIAVFSPHMVTNDLREF